MNSFLRIIVTGLIAQHRFLGGVAWDYLNFVLGLARLGHDVYYLEDSGEWPYNFDGGASGNNWVAYDCTETLKYLAKVMESSGLADRWAYHFPISPQWFGLSESKRKDLIKSADILINVSGTLEHPENYREVRRLVYVDTDPVFTHIELAQGQTDLLKRVDAHDFHFSVGECLGESVPSTGHDWRATKHPIVLSEWRSSVTQRDVFTTVMNWASYKPLIYQGKTYGQKDVEFKRFLELPKKSSGAALEIALAKTHHVRWETKDVELPPAVSALIRNHPEWTPHDLLTHTGWRVVDASEVCGDFHSYRKYIQSSKAEWSIAKNGYVRGRCGWFSGRSACYLAAGRPVVVQDTGFAPVLPVGEGILPFNTLEEAVVAIREVKNDYERHAKAARNIAEEYFDSDKVLTLLIDKTLNGH